MAEFRRLRDPIHDLIVFDLNSKSYPDRLAWSLINTPEFQRLRRIRQLGLSELVFPGATHTRFAHSIGVYNNARKLASVLHREVHEIDQDRLRVVLVAALLHDIGHGPFSHAFEVAKEKIAELRVIGPIKSHEKWSALLIRNRRGNIFNILGEDLATKVAGLIEADDPTDLYHAIVSSSFDADRLDYVVRDRYMTGVGAGGIDQSWLIDNLTTCTVDISQDDDDPQKIETFVFKLKGRQAAEDFLLARYRLYSQIYLHKTTRGFEQILTALFIRLAEKETTPESLGLDKNNSLLAILRSLEKESDESSVEERLALFLRLDDAVVWATIEQVAHCEDASISELAKRLLWRQPPKGIDLAAKLGDEPSTLINAEKRLDKFLGERLSVTVFKDRAPLNLYSRIGGEMSKEHKKVRVLNGAGKALDIIDFPETIVSKRLTSKDNLVRYFFLSPDEIKGAEKAMVGA